MNIPGTEGRAGNVSMFASQITGLACLWMDVVARIVLATIGRVKMTHRGCAVAIGRNWQSMDVVD